MFLRPGRKVPQQDERIDAQGFRDFKKLDDVQSPFAALEFRDIGLWSAESFGQLGLRQADTFSGLNEKLAEPRVCWREYGLCQTMGTTVEGCLNSLKPKLG